MKKTLCLLALLASPASAETILEEGAFDRFASGSTVYFNRHGAPYGAEQYFKNRSVIWTFLDGQCQRGVWYPNEDQICFLYETQIDPQCWYFLDDDGKRRARVVGDDPANDLVVARQDKRDLNCPGPGIGVSFETESN